MKKVVLSKFVFLMVGLLLIACTPPQPAGVELKTQAPKPGPAAAGAAGDQKWAGILAQAKKEGEVIVYTSIRAEARNALAEAFKDKYGMKLEFLTLSRGSEISARAASEQKAGLYMADAFITGSTNLVLEMKPQGLLGPFDPVLVLPEVRDLKAWRGEKLSFADKEQRVFDMIGAVWGAYLVNTDLVKDKEITSFLDVLKPVYKGKITLTDPGQPGSANALMTHLAHNLWNTDKAIDFLKQLLKQEPVITRDYRQHVEWVARGKYSIAIGPDSKQTAAFIGEGAPVGLVWPNEGVYTSSVGGALGISIRPQHPNAAAVFINWLLTKEGQTLFSEGFGLPSNRLDAPFAINPKLLPPGDLKIFSPSEEYLHLQGKIGEAVRGIMAAASK